MKTKFTSFFHNRLTGLSLSWSQMSKFRRFRRKLLSVLILAILAISAYQVWAYLNPDVADAWWDDGWLYRKKITFENSGDAQGSKTVHLPIDTSTLISEAKMQSGCQDTRFVDNNNQELEYKINTTQKQIQYAPRGTSYKSSDASTTQTFSHTVEDHPNQILVVVVNVRNATTDTLTVDTATFNGDSMTEQIENSYNPASGRTYVTAIYTLVNPDVGTYNVVVGLSGVNTHFQAAAMSFYNVDQSSPIGVTASNTGSSTSSLAITGTTTTSNSIIVGGAGRRSVLDGNGIQRDPVLRLPGKHVYTEISGNGNAHLGSSYGFQHAPTTGSNTMTYSLDDTANTEMFGAFVELKPTPAPLGCDTTTTNFEVMMPHINTGTNEVYMYYGNPSVSSGASNLTYSGGEIKIKESSTTGNYNDSTVTFNHTVTPGKNQVLVVMIAATREQVGDKPIKFVDVTFNGKPLARQAHVRGVYAGTENRNYASETWMLANPDVGEYTVSLRQAVMNNNDRTTSALGATAFTVEYANPYHYPIASVGSAKTTSLSLSPTTIANNSLLVGTLKTSKNTGSAPTTSMTSPSVRLTHLQQTDNDSTSLIGMASGYQIAATSGSKTFAGTADSAVAMIGSVIGLVQDLTYESLELDDTPTLGFEEENPRIGPVIYYKMDEGVNNTCSGGTNDICDSTSRGLDGAFGASTAAPAWQSEDLCIFGKCLFFDGSDDVATVTNTNYIDFDVGLKNGVSASFWVKPMSDGEGNAGRIFAKGTRFYCQTQNESGSYVDLYCTIDLATTDATVTVSQGLTLGRWHHVEVTYADDANDDLYVYIDGILRGTGNGSGAPASGDTNDLSIGGTSSNNFHGFIDEFKIFNYLRSNDQVLTDYLRGASKSGSSAGFGIPNYDFLNQGLMGYWKLDHASGNATDYSGFGNTLTNNGTTTYVGGKFGNGSEHVPASSQHFSTATTVSGVKTVSFWANPDSTTNYYVSLTSGAYITSSGGTLSATGFTDPKIYVNGIETTTIAADTWQLVTVTTDTAINANQLYLGRQGTNYYDGTLDELRLYNRALSADEARRLYDWAPGPVGHWKLDENTGSTAFDSSTNANNGTITAGSNKWQPGKFGSSISLNGSSEYVNYGDVDTLDFGATQDFTVGAWVKTNIDPVTDTYPVVITKEGGSPRNGYSILANVAQFSANWRGEIWVAGTQYNCSGNQDITNNQWHHLVLQRQGSNLRTYTNGVLSNTCAASSATIANAQNLVLGAGSGLAAGFLNGQIDDVRIYNYARSSAQVIEDMNAGHPMGGSPVGSQLIHYAFDEASGGTANNRISNYSSLSGSISGATWNLSSNCKYGNCLDFNGTSHYVETTDADALDITGDFTVSAWINPNAISGSRAIVSKRSTAGNFGGYSITLGGSGEVYCQTDSGSAYNDSVTGTGLITASNWQYVAIVRSGSSCRVYINGVDKTSTAQAHTTVGANSSNLRVGSAPNGAEYFNGKIDEVKIYAGALTPDQIKIDYNAGSALGVGVSTNERLALVDGDYQSNLVGHWPLDENTGTSTVADKSGNGYTGTMNSFTLSSWTSGKLGSGLTLDGSSTYITASSSINIANSDFTISAWVKRASTGSNHYFIGQGTNSNNQGLHIGYRSTNTLTCAFWNNDLTSSDTYTDTDWHHIVCTYDATTNSRRLYRDGRLVASDTASADYSGTGDFNIGRRPASPVTYGAGIVDDVKIFSSALTPAQVAYEYNRGAPLAWYRLDECSGTVINDASGNGFHGTLTVGGTGTYTSPGNCGSGTVSHAWNAGTIGKINSAIGLDGTNDYINTTNITALNSAASLSATAWFKTDTLTGGDASLRYIVSKEGANESGASFLIRLNTSTNQIEFYLGGAAYVGVFSSAISADRWYHVAGTWDGTTMRLYLDGIEVDNDSKSGATGTTSQPIKIGNVNIGSGEVRYWSGLIDDVRIYNYALSALQVKSVMNNGAIRFQ